jgi:hypothetical protein
MDVVAAGLKNSQIVPKRSMYIKFQFGSSICVLYALP